MPDRQSHGFQHQFVFDVIVLDAVQLIQFRLQATMLPDLKVKGYHKGYDSRNTNYP
jgi:hypothetical protein